MTLRPLLPLVLLALLPASARAGGLPITAQTAGPDGIVGRNGGDRFGALPTSRGTVLTRSQRRAAPVVQAAVVHGRAPRRPQEASVGGGSPWAMIAAGLAGLLVAAGGLRRVARPG
jgi:hypothetical protein